MELLSQSWLALVAWLLVLLVLAVLFLRVAGVIVGGIGRKSVEYGRMAQGVAQRAFLGLLLSVLALVATGALALSSPGGWLSKSVAAAMYSVIPLALLAPLLVLAALQRRR